MPHRSEDARIRSLLRRDNVDNMSRMEKVQALLDKYRARNVRPGDGEFTSDDDKIVYTVLCMLASELEDLKKNAHYHGDFVDG